MLLTLTGAMGLSAQSCPDNNHPHKIDLGLPSGTIWSCCNTGATSPTGYGGYYAWEETEEKTNYSSSSYQHYNNGVYTDFESGICGTEYDAAYVNSNGKYIMPTKDQLNELFTNCEYEFTSVSGVNGILFKSSNGASIFIPFGGYKQENGLYSQGSMSRVWSGTQHSGNISNADYLVAIKESSNVFMSWEQRFWGHNIRPMANPSSSADKEAYYDQVYEYVDPDDPSWGILCKRVTFYYDNLRGTRTNPTLLPTNGGKLFSSEGAEITVKFDSSFADYCPTNTSYWFSDLQSYPFLTFSGMGNLNTSEVTDMSYMFYGIKTVVLS